jgi:glutathione S-transferase
MATLYGVPLSQPFRAVLWPCLIKRLPIKLKIAVPGDVPKVGTKLPQFRDKFPLGTIPSLTSSCGNHISESGAILGFLADTHNWDDMYPKDLFERTKVNEYMHWHHNGTRNITNAYFVRYVRPELITSEDQILLNEMKAQNSLKTIENVFLREGNFISNISDVPTIADFMCYSEVSQVTFGNTFDLDSFPLIQAWMSKMTALPYHDETFASLKALGDLKDSSTPVSERLGPATKIGFAAIHSVLSDQ